jgi:hypothetical protein
MPESYHFLMISTISCEEPNFYSLMYSHKEHIEKWLVQFNDPNFVLSEICHIINKNFVTKKSEKIFLEKILASQDFLNDIGENGNYSILNIQQQGHSQQIYSEYLRNLFLSERGEDVPINDFNKQVLIYIDDFMFSGMKARHDIINHKTDWDLGAGGKKIIYIFMGTHTNAEYYLKNEFQKHNINFKLWRFVNLENSLYSKDNSDVFWPKENIADTDLVEKYARNLDYPVVFRSNTSNSVGKHQSFSSANARDKIEKEFLIAGLKIIDDCHTQFPPLGISAFTGIGFGGTLMSYHNVPNNLPLCLWWGNPINPGGLGSWYPLFMRKTW